MKLSGNNGLECPYFCTKFSFFDAKIIHKGKKDRKFMKKKQINFTWNFFCVKLRFSSACQEIKKTCLESHSVNVFI